MSTRIAVDESIVPSYEGLIELDIDATMAISLNILLAVPNELAIRKLRLYNTVYGVVMRLS